MTLYGELSQARNTLDNLRVRINNEGLSIKTRELREDATGSIVSTLNYAISSLDYYIKHYVEPVQPNIKPREH